MNPKNFALALSFILFFALSAAAAGQGTTPPKKEDKAAEPLEIQEIQEVKAVESPSRSGPVDLFGRFHPAMVHFPIGWMVLLLFCEAMALIGRGEDWSRAGSLVVLLAVASFIPAGISGFIRASALGSDPDAAPWVALHRNLNIAAAILCLGACIIRVRRKDPLLGSARLFYFGMIAVSTLLVMLAGHYGGKMVFGEKYLPF